MREATSRSRRGAIRPHNSRLRSVARSSRSVVAVTVLVAALLLPSPAMAQNGQVAVNVRLPDVLVLSYLTELQVQLSGGQFAGNGRGAAISADGQGTVGLAVHVDAALAAAVASGAASSTASGQLGGVFSVLGTSGSGRMQVAATVEHGTGTHAGGSSLSVTGVTAIVNSQQGTSVTFDAPGVAASVSGGIGLDVDLTDARAAGWYRGITLRLVVEQI